jgi:hypothetical protein
MKTPLVTKLAVTALTVAVTPFTGVAAAPSFSLAWSEYPSWSVFGVAHVQRLIDGRQGRQGPIEQKWNVDIVLKEAEYDPCLSMYGSGQCDAVCITNMDALNPAATRPSVVILPTSTSYGADALIVVNAIPDIKALRGKKVYGLAKSVSEYCFVRNSNCSARRSPTSNSAIWTPAPPPWPCNKSRRKSRLSSSGTRSSWKRSTSAAT